MMQPQDEGGQWESADLQAPSETCRNVTVEKMFSRGRLNRFHC